MTEQLLMADSDFQTLLRLGAENYELVHEEKMAFTFSSVSEAFEKARTYVKLNSLTPVDDVEEAGNAPDTVVSNSSGTDNPMTRILRTILNCLFKFESSTTREYAEAFHTGRRHEILWGNHSVSQ